MDSMKVQKQLASYSSINLSNLEALKIVLGNNAVAFKALASSMLPVIKNFTKIGLAISAVVLVAKALDAAIVTLDEQKEKLENVKTEFQNVTNELNEINSELSSIESKINDLKVIENPSFVEQSELDRLREVSRELERQKDLKEDSQLESAEKLFEENKKTVAKDLGSSIGGSYSSYTTDEMVSALNSGNISLSQFDLSSNISDMISAMAYLEEQKKIATNPSDILEYGQYLKDVTTSFQSYIEENGKTSLESISEYKQNIYEIASLRELTDDEQAFLDYLTEMQTAIYKFYDVGEYQKIKFDSLWESKEFENARNELIALSEAGKLDGDVLYRTTEYTRLLSETGATADEVVNHINSLYGVVEETNDAFEKFGSAFDFETFESKIKSIEDNYQTLKDAQEEFKESGSLTASTITSLVENGLIQYLEQTENGLTFNTDAFLKNAEAVKLDAKAQLYDAMCHDMQAIAMGNVGEVSSITKFALDELNDTVLESGENASTASEGWLSFAAVMNSMNLTDSTDIQSQLEATYNAYSNIANLLDSSFDVTKNKSKSTSSSKDKHLEAYKKKLSIFENELDQELITQKEFYTKSEALLNEYLKDTPKHIDTYAEEISDAEKKLHDVWNDAYEYDKSSLDKQLENGTINAHDYAIELENLINEYYALNNATQTYGKYTDELIKAQEDLAKAQKDSMEQSISAITMLIDKQIKKYEDAKESAEKANKAQIKAIEEQIDGYKTQIESYDKLIDKKDDEIKKLNEINEAHNTAIQLQKEQQALDNALNNKSIAKLVDGQIKYVVDDSAVKESRESLDEIHHQQAIDALEKEKELLEESKESIESQIDLLEKQQDTLEKTLEKSNEYFDNLIDSLNDSKDRISEVLEIQDNAKLLDNLKSTLGEMDLSINDIYNMSDSAFEKFKQSYLDKLSEMSEGNTQLQESMAEIANMDATETSVKVGQVATGLVDVAKAAENASKAIKSNDEESTSLTSAIDSSFDSASEKLPLESEMLDGVSSSAQIATENTNELKESIDSLTDKTVTITVVENHVSSSGGGGGTTQHIEAYAKGSKRIPYRQEGWTQEDGFELVFSPSRNAVLTKLEPNDMVLTHEMSENIWQWGKLNPDILKNSWSDDFNPSKIANVVTNNTDNRETNVTFNVSMPNVTNDTSARELINNLKSMSRRKYQYFN